VVTKYSKQIAARVDEETYQKLCKHALTNGISLSVYLREVITNLVKVLDDPENPQLQNLEQPEELKEPPKIEVAKPIEPIKRKPVVVETEPSESLVEEEEEKPKGLWQRFWDFMDQKIEFKW